MSSKSLIKGFVDFYIGENVGYSTTEHFNKDELLKRATMYSDMLSNFNKQPSNAAEA